MKVAIVGAGVAGLTAAYQIARAGHEVLVYEAASLPGGLASGFRDPAWRWPLERFYHHIFQTDHAILDLVRDIGFQGKLFFRAPVTAQWWNGRVYPLDGPTQVLRFPAMPFVDRLRFGLAIAYLKYIYADWQTLERFTASEWTRRYAGERAYQAVLRPLLEGKFGNHADEVNMAWLWARFRARSFKLGYFQGGFQAFADALCAEVERNGARVLLRAPVQALRPAEPGWLLSAAGEEQHVDRVIVTGSPQLLARLAPQLPEHYLGRLRELRSMGAVVLTIALRRRLTKGFYWINMPKETFPFLALVEHTNFIAPRHYGGDHLIYCGDYLDPDHEYFRLSQDELLQRFLPALQGVNPRFKPDWVRKAWLHREAYAPPIVPVNHGHNIPPLATPLPDLFWASMSQVYPWDRGTNFAVELGQQVAAEVLRPGLAPPGM